MIVFLGYRAVSQRCELNTAMRESSIMLRIFVVLGILSLVLILLLAFIIEYGPPELRSKKYINHSWRILYFLFT